MKKILSVATFLFVAIIASASLSPTGPDGGEYFITSGCIKCGTCVGHVLLEQSMKWTISTR